MTSYLYHRSIPPTYTKARKAYRSAFPSLRKAYGKIRTCAAIDQHSQQHDLCKCETAGPDEGKKDSLWETTKALVPWNSHKSPIPKLGGDSTNDTTGPLTPTTDDENDADALEAYYSVAKDDEHGDLIAQAATLLRIGTTTDCWRARAILLKMVDDDRVMIYDKSVCHYLLATYSDDSKGGIFYHARKTIYYHRLLESAGLDTEEDGTRYEMARKLMWDVRRLWRLDIQGLYRQLVNIAIDLFHRYATAELPLRLTMQGTIGALMGELWHYELNYKDMPSWITATLFFFSAMLGPPGERELIRARDSVQLFRDLIRGNPNFYQQLSAIYDCALDLEYDAIGRAQGEADVVVQQEVPPFSTKYYYRGPLLAGVFEPYVGGVS